MHKVSHLIASNITIYVEKYTIQQTQNICITFVDRRPNVFEVGLAQ